MHTDAEMGLMDNAILLTLAQLPHINQAQRLIGFDLFQTLSSGAVLRFGVVSRNPLGAFLDGFMVVDRSHRRAPGEGVNQELRQTGLVHPRV